MLIIDKPVINLVDETEDKIVHTIFDGMSYDISNPMLNSYEKMQQFCQNKSGNLVAVDSVDKLDVLIRLIEGSKNFRKDQKFLIGNMSIITQNYD